MNKKSVLIVIAAVFLTAVSFNSCTVGLGESVDTEVPTIDVTYPPKQANVSGWFLLGGTCGDDKGISSVVVTYSGTNTNGTTESGSLGKATINDGKWFIKLNTKTNDVYPILDGTYTFSATAADDAGHTTLASRVLNIDNTPPILIMSTPASYGMPIIPEAFGQSVKFAGDFSEQTNDKISKMDVSIYNKSDSSYVTSFTFSDVEMTSKTPFVIAKYASSEPDSTSEKNLYNNYLALYPSSTTAGTTKNYYFALTLTDGTLQYQDTNLSASTGTGNSTSTFYLSTDDVTSKLTSSSSSSLQMTVTQIKNFLNGTDTTYSKSNDPINYKMIVHTLSDAQAVSASSDEADLSGTDNAASFSVNPKNNPIFTVTNFALTPDGGDSYDSNGFFYYLSGNPINITISSGLDNAAVRFSDTDNPVVVSLIRLNDDVDLSSGAVSDHDYYTDSDGNQSKITLYTVDASTTANSTSKTISTTCSDSALLAGRKYVFSVSGADVNEKSIETDSNGPYVFVVKSSHNAPTISFTTDEDLCYSGTEAESNGVSIQGTVETDSIDLSSFIATVTVTDTASGESVTVNPVVSKTYAVSSDDSNVYDWTVKLSGSDFIPSDAGKYKYKVAVTAEDSDGNTTTSSLPFYIDNDAPSVSISSVSPVVDGTDSSGDSVEYVNGTITVKGIASDNNILSDVSYGVYESGSNTATLSGSLGKVESPSVDINTTSLADKTSYTIKLAVEDSVGNTSVATYAITVDQSTDAPKISLSNADDSITDTSKITTGTNLFGTTNNNKILGTITDDDGIASVSVGYRTAGTDDKYQSLDLNNGSPSGSTTYSLSCTLPSSEGQYEIEIAVTDSAGASTGYSSVTDDFVLAVDNGAPTLSVTTKSGAYQAATADLTVQGTASDGTGIVSLYRYSSSTISSVDLESSAKITVGSDGTWTDTIPAATVGTSGATKYYVATDTYGQTTTASFSYKVDAVAPTFTITKLGSTSLTGDNILSGGSASSVTKYVVQSDVYQIKGIVSDEGDSGIAGMYYYLGTEVPSLDSSSTAYALSEDGWTDCTIVTSSGTSTWTANMDLSDTTADTTYGVYLAAKDEAGNISLLSVNPCAVVNVIPDAAAPILSVATVNGDSATSLDSYYTTAVTVGGTVTETNLKSFTVISDAGDITIDTKPLSGTNSAWKFTIPSAGDWSTITITATDQAGQTATKILSTIIDTAEPTISSAYTLPTTDWRDSTSQTLVVPVSDTYSSSGSVYSSGINSVQYTTGTVSDSSEWINMAKGSTYSGNDAYTNYKATISSLSDGAATITIRAADNAENAAGTYVTLGSFIYNIDTTAPVLSDVSASDTLISGSDDLSGVTISATATDATSGTVSMTLYKNGSVVKDSDGNEVTWTQTASTTALSHTFTIPSASFEDDSGDVVDGTYSFTVKATDSAGNTSESDEITITVDTTAPTLTVSSLSSDSVITENNSYITATTSDGSTTYTYSARGSWEDSVSGTALLEYSTDSTDGSDGTWTTISSTSVTAAVSWIQDISVTEGSGNTIWFRATDKAGNVSKKEFSNITFDFAVPVITLNSYNSYTNEDAGSFTLSGTVTDSLAISSGKISVSVTKNGSAVTSGYTFAVNSGTAVTGTTSIPFTVTVSASDSTNDGSWSFIVSAIDDAGRAATGVSASTVIDTQAPVFQADNTTYPDYVAGKAYTSGTWYNASSLPISGCYSESGSGISAVYYQVITSGDSGTTTMTNTNYSTVHTGSFSTTDHGSIESFNATIGSFEAGSSANMLRLVAVDFAGNVSAVLERYIYVDQETPEIEADSDYSDTILTNAASSVTVTGTATDDASGIASVSVYIGSGTYTISSSDTEYGTITLENTGNYSSVNTKWTLVMNSTVLAAQSGNVSVYATVTDSAGNSNKVKICSLLVDTIAPTVSVSSPSTASSLNGTKTISGTVTESNTPVSIALYYSTASTVPTSLSNWTGYKKITTASSSDDTDTTSYSDGTVTDADVSAIYNWSMSGFDFTTISGAKSSNDGTGTVYILPVAYDKAGNCSVTDSSISSSDYYTYTVDQDKDRPVISISNLDLSDMTSSNFVWLKSMSTLYGSVTDDDGISSMEIGYKYGNASDFTVSTVTVSSGSWSFALPSGDGSYTIEFIVADTGGSTFTTASSDATEKALLAMPKITDGTNKFGYATSSPDTLIYLKEDTTAPEVTAAGISTDGLAVTSSSKTWNTSYSSLLVGGTTESFMLKVTATDANDIASVSAVTTGLDGVSSVTYAATAMTSDNTAAGTDDGISYWLFSDIACNKGTGSMAIKITATDDAALTATASLSVAVDNTAPEITVLGPSSTTTSSGDITVYGSVDSTSTMYYAVSPINTVSPDDDNSNTSFTWTDATGDNTTLGDLSSKTTYTQISDSSLSWYVYFDGDTDSSNTTTHNQTLNDYLVDFGITTTAKLKSDTDPFDTVTDLYIWIKSVDSAGNVKETAHLVQLDPQGGRPTVTIDYPEENGDTVGGTVKLYGSAEDDEAVDSVWVQIVSKQHNDSSLTANGTDFGTFTYDSSSYNLSTFEPTADDLDYLAAAGYDVEKMSDGTVWAAGSSSLESDSASDYAIKATFSGTSWNLKINAGSEFDPSSGTTNAVAIRGYSYDGSSFSIASDRVVIFDADNPVIGNAQALYLVQSSDSDYDTTATASQEYSDDMYVKGSWYLIGSVEDSDYINTLTIGDNTIISNGSAASGSWTGDVKLENSSGTTVSSNGSICYFKYLLGTDSGVGTVSFDITAVDGSEKENTTVQSITINYDNTPPVLVDSSNENYDISPTVTQSNNFYTFGSQVTEESVSGTSQSGFKRLAFYFLRRNTTGSSEVDSVYDPMLVQSNSLNSNAMTNITTSSTASSDGDIIYDSGLYWKYESVTRDLDNLPVLTLSSSDDNIHADGLVKIGGTIYTISSVSGTTVTLDGNPDSSYTKAYFALALVVDNTTTESESGSLQDDGYYESPLNDDGDRMIEGVTKSGTTWTWEANICSKNIPDGPIEIHYVAFDKAGNYSVGIVGHVPESTYTGYSTADAKEAGSDSDLLYVYDSSNPAFVSNNAPRLAGVSVGTDLDGDGSIDGTINGSESYNEWDTTYYGKYTDSKDYVSKMVLSSDGTTSGAALLTAKGYTEIVPEIVGGNGSLYYQYTYGSTVSDQNTGDTIKTPLVTAGTTDDKVDTLATNIILQTGDFLRHGISDATTYWFTFKIWDSTEGTTTFTDSQKAVIQLAMGVDITDDETPTVSMNDFYWNNSSDNSLYKNKTTNGHIELSSDWKSSAAYDSDASSGEYDADPKVSGGIVLSGTVSDNSVISRLYMYIPQFTKQFAATEYDESSLSTKTIDGNAYYLVATYTTGSGWTGYGDYDKYGWNITFDDDSFTSSGQSVTWHFDWNTALTNDVAKADVKVYAAATDVGSPDIATSKKNSDGTYTYTYTYDSNTGSAGTKQMDIVPYVRELHTSIRTSSGLKDDNLRSASGKYSIIEGGMNDFITVDGFNLNPSVVYVVNSSNVSGQSISSSTGTKLSPYSLTDSKYYTEFTLSNAISASGYLEVLTNGVRMLNNINNNDSVGDYKTTGTDSIDYQQMYDREPNLSSTKDIQLTDDRYLRMFNMRQTGVKNGYYPTMILDEDNDYNPVFGYINPAGASGINSYMDTCYMPQRSKFDLSNGSTSSTSYIVGGLAWDQFAMAKDYLGKYIMATVYNYSDASLALYYNEYAKNHSFTSGGGWTYKYAGWGPGTTYSGYDGNYAYSTGNNAINLESVSYGSLQTDRYLYPKIVTKGDSSTGYDKVYMAYYDDETGEILLRDLRISSTYNSNYGTTTGLNGCYTNFTENTKNLSTWNRGRLKVSAHGSKYFDLGVTSDNHVVVVYYDTSTGKLVMKYSASAVDCSSPETDITWATSSVSFPSYVGTYVSMAIDDNDQIHIAAYDANDGNLVYLYLPSYDGSLTYMTVDQASSVGYWTQIKVNNDVVYISYYNSTESGSRDSIKLAYSTQSIGSITAGVDDDDYTTGKWEYMTVPAITPPQGDSNKFKQISLDFLSDGTPVVGYLGTYLEFGNWLSEN